LASGLSASSFGNNTITSDKIVSVANTKISGNITSSQIAPSQTFYGNTALTGLLDLSATNAGQIKFPATQNASSDANTLDDYEEGTFTPTISGSTSAGAGSYDVQQGTYTKIGNLVTLNARMAWSAHTGTGNLEFTNYPFTSINTTNYRASGTFGAFSNVALTANNVALFLMVPNENKSIVSQYPVGGGAPSNVPMDTAGSVHFAITYQTS
jgi:hypothetical protein